MPEEKDTTTGKKPNLNEDAYDIWKRLGSRYIPNPKENIPDGREGRLKAGEVLDLDNWIDGWKDGIPMAPRDIRSDEPDARLEGTRFEGYPTLDAIEELVPAFKAWTAGDEGSFGSCGKAVDPDDGGYRRKILADIREWVYSSLVQPGSKHADEAKARDFSDRAGLFLYLLWRGAYEAL